MYFKNFPNTETLVKDNIVNVKNILRQAVFTNESIEKDRAYTTYKMKDSDTLESIALSLYGREDLSWLLMMFNEMIDPMYDSSLNTISMDNFINKKYDGQALFISPTDTQEPFFDPNLSWDVADVVTVSFFDDQGVEQFKNEDVFGRVKVVDNIYSRL